MSNFRHWLRSHSRAIFWWAYLIALVIGGLLIVGCANTPLPRQDWDMPEGMVVTVVFKSPQEIVAAQKTNPLPEFYEAKALTWMIDPGKQALVWMPPGQLDTLLLAHEFQHATGRRHDRNGNWLIPN